MAFNYFDEDGGSPTISFSPYGSTAVRGGVVPWNQLNALVAYVFPTNGIPHALPGFPGILATTMSLEPLGGQYAKTTNTTPGTMGQGDLDTTNIAQYAHVVINYETAKVELLSGGGNDPVANLTHHISIGGQMLDANPAGLVWATGNEKVNSDVGASVYIPTMEHSITWNQVVSPPFSAMRTCLGTVNNANLTFNTGVMAAETALFVGAELERDILSTGALAWRVTYNFSERRVVPASDDGDTIGGWNHFWRSESSQDPAVEGKTGWYRLAFAGSRVNSGDPIFRLENHSTLFA